MLAFQKLYQGFFCALLVVATLGCSSKGSDTRGSSSAPAPEPAPPPTDPNGALLTSVGLDGMAYHLPTMASCLTRDDDHYRLPVFAAGAFKADGVIDEWAAITPLARDTVGDAEASADIVSVSAGISDNNLALMIAASPGAGISLGVEFTNAYLRRGVLGGDVTLRLRIYQGILERMIGNTWQALPENLGTVAITPAYTELRLARDLVGESLTYPAWSIRVFSRDERTGAVRDTTSAAYRPSWVDPDKPPLVLSTCKTWYTQQQPIELVEIREPEAPAGLAGDSAKTFADIQDRVGKLARLAIDAGIQAFHGESPPVLQLSVFETFNKPADGAYDSPFSAVAVDLAVFTNPSTAAFPEGPVFRRIAAQVIDLFLLKLYPSAESGLRLAVKQALLDHLVREAFGASYFFDTYRGTLLSNDANVAWGHVLGGVMTSDQLVAAWRLLAAGATTVSVFGDKTRETALAAVVDTDFDGLPDNYEAVYGTDPKRADSDGDSWSDLAEVVNSEDPLAQTRQPNRIMPDGNFDDWLTLFPQKVHLDEGHSVACPVAADIAFYAALASPDELMIGAVAREFWENEPLASWEVVIDLPNSKQQFLISVPSDSYSTTVKDPTTGRVLLTIERAFPQGRKTVEWVFTRKDLKVTEAFDVPDNVRIRIRTLFHDAAGKDNYCDETAWFAPYVTR